jgi:hypothetical protein
MRVGGAIPRGGAGFDAGSVAPAHDWAISAQSTINVRFMVNTPPAPVYKRGRHNAGVP